MGIVEDTLARHKELLAKKAPWLEMFQIVGEYVHTKKQDFTSAAVPGSMLNKNLFDSCAPKSARKAAAALVGMLWQNGAKSLQVQPPKELAESNEVKEYFDKVNDNVREDFDDTRAGLALALEEYMNDQQCFGTSGIAAFPGQESNLLFESWGVSDCSVDEGEGGRIDTIYREYCWSLRRVAQTYGEKLLSPKLQESIRTGKLDDKIKILHALEPRKIFARSAMNNLNMPYRSLHLEIESKHVIRESGYEELPVNMARIYKKAGEAYGRSPAMDAIPDILEANAVKEARLIALEKKLDPPLGVYSDSVLGNGKINTSAGETTVVKASGKMGSRQPIFPLFEIGDIREADKQIADLETSIKEHFNIDRLLDFSNEAEMTLGEARMRAQIRGEGLGALFNRQISETFTPFIERGISILYRKGRLGVIKGSAQHRFALASGEQPIVIPDSIAKLIHAGKSFYEIKYFSPAARIMESDQANGIIRTWEFARSLADAGQEDVFDGLNADKSLEAIARIEGAPATIINSNEKRDKTREVRTQMLQQQAEMQQAAQAAEVAATASNIKPAA